MHVRRLPGAVALGLLASVLGHAFAYGREHAMGGAYHGILLPLVVAGVGSFLFAAMALAWIGAGRASDGSVLASRIVPFLPNFGQLMVSGVAWFQLFESIEGHHPQAAAIWVIAALAAASLFVYKSARAVVRAIAALVISIRSAPFAQRSLAVMRRLNRPRPIRAAAHVNRIFARPPPSLMRAA